MAAIFIEWRKLEYLEKTTIICYSLTTFILFYSYVGIFSEERNITKKVGKLMMKKTAGHWVLLHVHVCFTGTSHLYYMYMSVFYRDQQFIAHCVRRKDIWNILVQKNCYQNLYQFQRWQNHIQKCYLHYWKEFQVSLGLVVVNLLITSFLVILRIIQTENYILDTVF